MSEFYRLLCHENGELLELRGRVFILGRSSECDLEVTAKDASRRHLALEIDRGVLYVEDLQSANGTFVNGHRCRTRRVLKSRDVLGVANIEYIVLGPGESESLTRVSYQPSPQASSFITDEDDGDMTMFAGSYPLPPDWPEAEAVAVAVDSEIPKSSLHGMEQELEMRLLSDRLMAGEIPAAFWHRHTSPGEDQLLKVPPSSGQSWTMGRGTECDLRLTDFSVSALHARLDLTDYGWQLSDVNSTNGISVNGRPIKQDSLLVSGDVVTLGGVELTFRSLIKK